MYRPNDICMKKQILFIIFFCFILISLKGQTSKTVNITAGKLWSSVKVSEKESISSLTITGTMDARDFIQLKDSFPSLTTLNLDNVSITAFGSSVANAIPDGAFYNNVKLKSIVLPKNISSIGGNAFNGCLNITSINFPASLTTINVSSFQNFGGLFSVNGSNNNFAAYNGVLYNKAQTDVLQCPVSLSGSLSLAPTTTTIKSNSFLGCLKVSDIVSSNTNPLTIEIYAFKGCTGLVSFTTSASTLTLGESSFENCSKLNKIKANDLDVGVKAFINCSSLTTVDGSVFTMGNMAFYSCTNLQTITFKAPLSTIPLNAFTSCRSLTSVNLPSSVTSIGYAAFNNCTALTSFTATNIALDGSVFNGCNQLISMNANLTSIGMSAFNGCSKLKNIQIAPNLPSIGATAFYGCTSLVTFTIPATVTSIGDGAFRYCNGPFDVDPSNPNYASLGGILFDKNIKTLIQSPTSNSNIYTIPDGVTTLKSYSFFNNTLLNTINIPQSVCTIEPATFLMCSAKKYNINSSNTCFSTSTDGLVIFNVDTTKLIFCSPKKTGSYTMPNKVVEIADFAFSNCTLLTSVVMNNGLKYINASAFDGAGINAINIPSTVTSMGAYAFANCTKALSINIPTSITDIGDYTFANCKVASTISLPSTLQVIGEYAFSGCTAWSGNLVFPPAVNTIKKYAFGNCSGLTGALNIPSTLSIINEGVFNNCVGFTTVDIPSSITSIEAYAFNSCKGFKKITIPSTVTSIKSYAFANCTGLTSLNAIAATPIDLSLTPAVFNNVNKKKCTLFVPTGSKVLYKAANQWKDFYYMIEGFGFWAEKDTVIMADKAMTDSIAIGANTVWNTRVISSTPWLSCSPASAANDGMLYISVTENTGDARIGKIEISSQYSKDTVVVIQSATSQVPDVDIQIKALNQCNHQLYKFTVIKKTNPIGSFTYNWDFGDSGVGTTTSTTINHDYTNPKSITYDINLTVTFGVYHRTFTIKFTSDELPDIILDNKPNLCEGDTMVVHAHGANRYIWSNGSQLDSLIITSSGDYSVQGIKNDTLCAIKTFKVSYFDPFEYVIHTDENEIKSYVPMVHAWVDDIPSSEYEWEFGDGGMVEGRDVNYIYNNGKTGYYKITLNVTNPHGCKQKFTKYIKIVGSEAPNTFTPNGDGTNDYFMKGYRIKVFDRFGQLLYNGTEGWDGTYKGNNMPQDTYYYVIELKTQTQTKRVSNYVMLIR